MSWSWCVACGPGMPLRKVRRCLCRQYLRLRLGFPAEEQDKRNDDATCEKLGEMSAHRDSISGDSTALTHQEDDAQEHNDKTTGDGECYQPSRSRRPT